MTILFLTDTAMVHKIISLFSLDLRIKELALPIWKATYGYSHN